MLELTQYFADGAWRRAMGEDLQPVFSPATETRVATVRSCSNADVDHAFRSARRAFSSWRRSTLDERRTMLRALAQALGSRAEAFIHAYATEVGAPVFLGRAMMVPMPLANLEHIIAGLDEIAWSERIGNSRVEKVPAGVVAAVTPWNAPLHQIVAKVAGVIGAGCSVVLKPSELAPTVAQLFAEALLESGLPDGVFNLVWGGAELGNYVVSHPDVDFVSFTGSRDVGEKVVQASAHGIKRVALELGGKSAAVLLEDADLETAVAAAFAQSIGHSGQTCVAQSRLIVPRHCRARVEELLKALADDVKIGDPHDEATRLGPVSNSRQFERVNRYIESADQEGVRRIAGGSGRPRGFERGFFIAPTVFSDVSASMKLAQDEVFGPVLAVMYYDTDEEALRIANGTRFGLSGAVWSSDPARAEAFAAEMHTAQVIVNGAPRNLGAPFGGMRESGYGRENGRFSIEAFLELKNVQLPA